MSIETSLQERELTITLVGEIGNEEAEELRRVSADHIKPAIDVVRVDLSGLKFISSSGLGVLVGMKLMSKSAKAEITLVNPSNDALHVLRLNSLDKVFRVEISD